MMAMKWSVKNGFFDEETKMGLICFCLKCVFDYGTMMFWLGVVDGG